MNRPAFYLPPNQWENGPTLTDDEIAHANVLRLKPGEEIILLDGMGRVCVCRIRKLEKRSVELEYMAEKISPPPKAKPILALALSKAVRRDFFMEKAAELGAWGIWLWQARYSQGKLDESLASSIRGRLIAGIKQSKNPWLPIVRVFQGITPVIMESREMAWHILPWEVQSGVPMALPQDLGREGETIYVIGPEGGFADEELHLLKNAGFSAVSFGNRILRCETAATLCLGLHWWASQLPGHPDFRDGNDG